jgi:hypothetical protein
MPNRPNKNYGAILNEVDEDEALNERLLKSHEEPRRASNTSNRSQFERQLSRYKSDSFLNYDNYNDGIVRKDFFNQSITLLDRDITEEDDASSTASAAAHDDFTQTSSEIILSQSLCNCSYIVEPVAFIQNLAASIMGISLGQFIYNRILTRLVNQAIDGKNSTNMTEIVTASFAYLTNLTTTTKASNHSDSCTHVLPPSNSSGSILLHSAIRFVQKAEFTGRFLPSPLISEIAFSHQRNSFDMLYDQASQQLTPDEFDAVRTQAQSQTAHLYFISSLYLGIPVIIMTNILGVNCTALGRKTLMLIFLFAMTVKSFLILCQCLYPEWPDWLFYLGAFIEGLSGSTGVFYLSLYCYISDFTSPSSRSYRITFLNNLNSVASLCVTFACGYVIKYYGYFYLFLTSSVLMALALVYTIFLIPEPLVELRDKSILQRLRTCSIKRAVNCFKVYFSKENERCARENKRDALTDAEDHENQSLLPSNPENQRLSKQTFVLLLIVFANFIYNFGTVGIGSIFGLFIMNTPFCFDSVQISNYTVFATLVSLFMSLMVSKFLKINDVLICILSVASYFGSVFCYIYGTTPHYIYLGAVIGSISGLEYGYVRSIVSKSVEKHEVADALSLILIVDTCIAVVSNVLFPILYSSIVSNGIGILLAFSNGFILMAMIFHM